MFHTLNERQGKDSPLNLSKGAVIRVCGRHPHRLVSLAFSVLHFEQLALKFREELRGRLIGFRHLPDTELRSRAQPGSLGAQQTCCVDWKLSSMPGISR